jgi:hypothetical protein
MEQVQADRKTIVSTHQHQAAAAKGHPGRRMLIKSYGSEMNLLDQEMKDKEKAEKQLKGIGEEEEEEAAAVAAAGHSPGGFKHFRRMSNSGL